MGATDQLLVTSHKVLANRVPSTHGVLADVLREGLRRQLMTLTV